MTRRTWIIKAKPDAEAFGESHPVGAILRFTTDGRKILDRNGNPVWGLPNGWLMCDGRKVRKSDFPELAEVISQQYSRKRGKRFTLPDLRMRKV